MHEVAQPGFWLTCVSGVNSCNGVNSCYGVNLCYGVKSCYGVNLCYGGVGGWERACNMMRVAQVGARPQFLIEIHLFYINDDWINTIVKAKHTNQVYI